MWWKPARCGYTLALTEAGRYSFVEATEILARANFVRVNECTIPIEAVITATEGSTNGEHWSNDRNPGVR